MRNEPSASASASSSSPDARRFWLLALLSGAAAAVVSACKTAPGGPSTDSQGVSGPGTARSSARSSNAGTPRAYREDGASHLYGLNANRIYKGKMPPLLYAVGVMNVEIDRDGKVTRLDWMRAPLHAPEVMAEIERTIRQASPFPAPTRLGKVVYTDTWLWHVSGKFQLDTLTEGQS
jgi:periplasmic protein TonB